MKNNKLQPEGFKKIGQNAYLGAVNTTIQTVAVVAFLIPPAAMGKGNSFKPARLSNSNHYEKKAHSDTSTLQATEAIQIKIKNY